MIMNRMDLRTKLLKLYLLYTSNIISFISFSLIRAKYNTSNINQISLQGCLTLNESV